METASCCGEYLLPTDFLNFLRGMETCPRRPRSRRRTAFLNFLRGMETPEGGGPHAPPSRFLNFLRGMETPQSPQGDAGVHPS